MHNTGAQDLGHALHERSRRRDDLRLEPRIPSKHLPHEHPRKVVMLTHPRDV